jgi:hypothetical protein
MLAPPGEIPAHPALEVFHPGSQPLVPRGQLADQPVRLSQPRRQLGSGQHRKLLRGRSTGRIGHTRQ